MFCVLHCPTQPPYPSPSTTFFRSSPLLLCLTLLLCAPCTICRHQKKANEKFCSPAIYHLACNSMRLLLLFVRGRKETERGIQAFGYGCEHVVDASIGAFFFSRVVLFYSKLQPSRFTIRSFSFVDNNNPCRAPDKSQWNSTYEVREQRQYDLKPKCSNRRRRRRWNETNRKLCTGLWASPFPFPMFWPIAPIAIVLLDPISLCCLFYYLVSCVCVWLCQFFFSFDVHLWLSLPPSSAGADSAIW